MTTVVETTQGKITLSDEELETLDKALNTAFDAVRRNRGISSDVIMVMCHAISSKNRRKTFALMKYAKEGLIPYQDTRDQTRYTREGEYQPFTESYEATRRETIERLKKGKTVTIRKGDTVQNRVIYDMMKNYETEKVYKNRVKGWKGD